MTEQLEQELSHLFHLAAAGVDVQPSGPRRTRVTRLNAALAAALTLALIVGVAVAGTRLASGTSHRGTVSLAGGDAKTQLLSALRHTFDRPIRIVTRVQQGSGNLQTSVTDMDYARQVAVERANGQVELLAVRGHMYQRLSGGLETMVKVPAGVQWMEISLPPAMNPALATASAGGWASLFGVDPGRLDDPAMTARLTVVRVDETRFQVSTPVEGQQHSQGQFTVGSDGTVTTGSIRVTVDPGGIPGMSAMPVEHISVELTIERLTSPLRLSPPNPRTVITNEQFQRLFRHGQTSEPSTCQTTTPTPTADGEQTTSVVCSSSVSSGTLTIVGRARPAPGHS